MDQLFLAGILPGILLLILLSFFSIQKANSSNIPKTNFSLLNLLTSIKGMAWEIPLPFLVLGGIYSGYFVVSEAAAITAIYVLIIEVFIYKDIKLRELGIIMRKSMVLVGSILIILGTSLGLTNYLIDKEIPMKILELFKNYISSPVLFLGLLNLFLLAVGCIMGIFSALTVIVPLISPIANAYGIDPIHLGIIFLTNLEIGASLPPLGINLFISSIRFEKSVLTLYFASLPFIGILLIGLAVITYFPWLSHVLIK